MATRSGRNKDRVTLSWRELSEALSIAKVLLPHEDVVNLTLVKPRALLIITNQSLSNPVVTE